MKRIRWELKLAMALVAASAILYILHYIIFSDSHHIFIYLLGDIAFVPIDVLLVTLIIHKVLNIRDKRQKMEKMNIVIGAFFSEVGTRLLVHLSDSDPNLDKIRDSLIVENDWNDDEFDRAEAVLREYSYDVDIGKVDLQCLKEFLVGKRGFLVRLLENPMLLEHESFTDLLQAVFHAVEELESRKDLDKLPATDLEHLRGDLKRVYIQLVGEWLDYMRHLQRHYPYLFSLAMRLNPFDMESNPIVR